MGQVPPQMSKQIKEIEEADRQKHVHADQRPQPVSSRYRRNSPPQVCTAIVVERMCEVITAVCGVNGSLLVMSYLCALAATGHLAAMLRVEIL